MANFKDIMALCLDGATYSAIAAALGCSRRDIAKVKTLIADHGITKESFAQLDPSFFDEHFSDHRGARRKRYDQPDFEKLAKRLANNKHLTRHKPNIPNNCPMSFPTIFSEVPSAAAMSLSDNTPSRRHAGSS